jgi:hypothetical protein
MSATDGDIFTDELIAQLNAAEDAEYAAMQVGGEFRTPHDDFTVALIAVKRALYMQFLDITEGDHEQNVNIIIKDYPKYLADWAAELSKGAANIPPPAKKVSSVLKSALENLKPAMTACIESDPYFGEEKCRRLINTVFVKYPYTYNTNDM